MGSPQARSRLGVDVEARAILPLVGRLGELGVILDAFGRAKSQREPQLVTLVGVPGIGKSRLVGEFFARLEQQPDLVWWRQGRALPYGEGVSLWALAEMVKAQAGIEENDSLEHAAEKLSASVETLVDEEERGWVLLHLLPLVGGETQMPGGNSLPAWRRYFEGLAEQRPLVMVFEDMHWADESLLDFVDHLVEWSSGVPLLVLATSRPELLDRRPGWAGGKLNSTTVALTPLTDDESAQIIHGVLERTVLPAETQRELLERAGGNPLYAEQFALLFRERGTTADLPMPETVQGLIAARLDGLTVEEKRVVQDGAVHGKVFWAGAVGAGEEALHSLERKGMVRRERRSSVGGEAQYSFRHVLVRDVAYGQIPRSARGEKHVAAADWIEGFGRADDHAELVAHHLAAAAELGPVDEGRLRAAVRRAGDRAAALGAFPSAERYYGHALELWPGDDPARPSLLAAQARIRFQTASEIEPLVEALDALEAAGDREAAADLAAFTAQAYWYTGDLTASNAMLARGRRLLEGLEQSPALAALLAERARQSAFQERFEEAETDAAAALELAERFALDDLRANVLTTKGVIRMSQGDLDEARRLFETAREGAPPGSPVRFRALANLGVVEYTAANQAAWKQRYEAATEAALRAGDRTNLHWIESNVVSHALEDGRWDEALRRCDVLSAAGPGYGNRTGRLVKAEVLAARGEIVQAIALVDEVLGGLSEKADNQMYMPTLIGSAWIALIAGDEARARGLVLKASERRTLHRAPAIGARLPVLMLRTGMRDVWIERVRGNAPIKRQRAAMLLFDGESVAAAELYAEISAYDEAVARLEAARELVDAGRRAEADVQLQRGLAFFRAVGATKIVRDAEALLAAAS